MCMFSQPVPWVASTSIFGRVTERGTQLLAYSMSFAAADELAMILPLPVLPDSGEHAVGFIDLSGYPTFFDDLASGFPEPKVHTYSRSLEEPPPAKLVVHDVGDFEASYVPTVADFGRLDERFRLPHQLWDRLPNYASYGFAVFKLRGKPTQQRVHPMALEFPTRSPERTFFPTLHVHDQEIHPSAVFDHALYVQRPGEPDSQWYPSVGPALMLVDVGRARDLVIGDEYYFRREMWGSLPNDDVWV
jgi:hypothetical protein